MFILKIAGIIIAVLFLIFYYSGKINLSYPMLGGGIMNIGQKMNLPKEIPSDFPIYPYGRITSFLLPNKNSPILSLKTTDNPYTVYNWYRIQLKNKSWGIGDGSNINDVKDIAYIRFENSKYKGSMTISNQDHQNPGKITKETRINIGFQKI